MLRLPCFYHPEYHLPLPAGHPFPMEKFSEARDLLDRPDSVVEIFPVAAAPNRLLLRVHTSEYLIKLNQGTLDRREIHKLGLPWQPRLLHRSALETAGTIAACQHALQHGLAANLAGGTHHAFPDQGLGYCVLNDVATAIRELQSRNPTIRIFIADTDAHQGNGNHAIFRQDDNVFTYSIHGARNYPSAKEPGDLDVGLPRYVLGKEYLEALRQSLPEALDRFQADLVIWISGVDVHQDDRFGQMRLSTEEIQERDHLVAKWCFIRGLPLTVLYGGGYHRTTSMTGRLHANTIEEVAAACPPALDVPAA